MRLISSDFGNFIASYKSWSHELLNVFRVHDLDFLGFWHNYISSQYFTLIAQPPAWASLFYRTDFSKNPSKIQQSKPTRRHIWNMPLHTFSLLLMALNCMKEKGTTSLRIKIGRKPFNPLSSSFSSFKQDPFNLQGKC